jgi:hypothetical protein
MCDLEHILLALTPMERWSATRQLQTESWSSSWFLLGTGATLLVLIVLLVVVSIKQRARSWVLPPEEPQDAGAPPAPAEDLTPPPPPAPPAQPVGLTTRDNQILLGIAMCGGDQDSQDIFTSAEAFDQGARNLLADCVETSPPCGRSWVSPRRRREVARVRTVRAAGIFPWVHVWC